MSEDILERAKKALIDDDMTYEDYDECISLLITEVERLRSANPFDVDVSVAMRVFDDHFVYGSEESTKILQELCDGITSMKARIKELEAHEQQTHEILGKILGNDDSLETVARRAITKIERLEAAFLKAETLARSYTKVYPDAKLGGTVWYWAKTDAREELERIKEGRKDE